MPITDWFAMARFGARALFLVGMFATIGGIISQLVIGINDIVGIYNNTISSISDKLSNTSSGGVSCLFAFLDLMGLNSVLLSFSSSLFGLIALYGSSVVLMMIARITLSLNKLVLEHI